MTGWQQTPATAVLILADGTRLEGFGLGAVGHAAGEVCFNTAMTGYQEVLTDPSYAGQIITFTFPHIGNVGTNDEDIETVNMAALSGVRGVVLKADITNPSNYRAAEKLDPGDRLLCDGHDSGCFDRPAGAGHVHQRIAGHGQIDERQGFLVDELGKGGELKEAFVTG